MKNWIYMVISIIMMSACSKEAEMPLSGDLSLQEGSPSELVRSGAEDWLSGLARDDNADAVSLSDGSLSCTTMPNVGIVYTNGMLSFPSSSAFRTAYAVLDCQADNFSGYSAYMTLYGGDLYKIDSVLDAKGIDEDKPLNDFEKKYAGFLSLRRQLNNTEESFLAAGGEPGSANAPGAHASDDPVFNTFLNAQGCLKVGDTIVKIFPNGVAYLVTDGNFSTLSQITDQYATRVFRAPNVIALWNEDTTDISGLMPCYTRLNHTTPDYEFYYYNYAGKNYKFCTYVRVTNVPFFHAYTALSKNYVRKNNRWKKARMNMYAHVQQALKSCRRIDYANVRFPSNGYIYRKHVRAIYKSNIFHLLNQGSTSYNNTLYIAGNKGNLRAVNGLKYGNTAITRTVILTW